MRSFILPGCIAVVGCLVVGACSSDSPQQGGFVNTTGGSSGSGGSSGAAGSGGSSGGSGGAPAGSGGAAGATGGSGGAAGTGAAGTGSAGTGGAASDAGGSAGSATPPTPDASAGGNGGAGGGASDASVVNRDATSPIGEGGLASSVPSAGCGKAAPAVDTSATSSTDGYASHALTVTGVRLPNAANRTYFVRLPAGYDPAKPYRTVYLGPGCSPPQNPTSATRKVYPIETESKDQAILVALEPGLYNVSDYAATDFCFDDMVTDSVEYQYFDALHKAIESTYCVDTKRQFLAGYSSSGWMGHMLGCAFPDVLRAQATVTGKLPPSLSETNMPTATQKTCVDKPIAAFFIHDRNDVSNTYDGSVSAAHRLFIANKCTGTFTPPTSLADRAATPPRLAAGQAAYTVVDPNTKVAMATTATWGCIQYNGCPADYPITFCTSDGAGHDSQATKAVPAFWEYFNKF